MQPPDYFQSVQREATKRWNMLVADPVLAAPWYQLFEQVQFPHHVLSELLQNADDANADEVTVEIRNGEFIFSHNGEDFNEEQFRSLCRFGFSNKRVLHTIGFRGIGFKSTFSIGDDVKLFTPTLAVLFNSKRFSEPIWLKDTKILPSLTEVRVAITDEHRRAELENNFQDWLTNPVSLLFFKKIRHLKINSKEVHWVPQGTGPVEHSTWMVLSSNPDRKYLLIQSEDENFPDDALQEIKETRKVPSKDFDLPPCRVEIVLGAEGRLFVVLPTSAITKLPFACNAPFIQNPDRVTIKNPVISTTNHWLLKRTGELAAHSAYDWVNNNKISVADRCNAYNLWPDVDKNDTTLEGICARQVEEEFKNTIQDRPCLLSENGKVEQRKKCVAIPPELIAVWSPEQVSSYFDPQIRPLLHYGVSVENLKKLVHSDFIDQIDKSQIILILENKNLPKPETWQNLMVLWAYLVEEVTRYYGGYKSVRIVPVQGQDTLYAANEVIRFGKDQLLQSDDDRGFLSKFLLVQNPNWLRYLSEQRTNLQNKLNEITDPSKKAIQIVENIRSPVESAYKVLIAIGLADASEVGYVMAQVTAKFFAQPSVQIADCVRLAHIAAKLNTPIPENFQYITKDNQCRLASKVITADLTHDIDLFTEEDWCQQNVLHEDYFTPSKSCTDSEWKQWVQSDRSRLRTFIPIIQLSNEVYGKETIMSKLQARGFTGNMELSYKTAWFRFDDWDFKHDRWERWKVLAQNDHLFWVRVLDHVIQESPNYWSKTLLSKCFQIATTGNSKPVTQEPIPSTWIMKFRNLPCLSDTWGNPHQPAELLLRTPDTEALLGTEPFIMAEMDNPVNRPLLRMLGVRENPTGPERLIERIKILSRAASPPIQEVLKWYQTLDRMIFRCSTEQFQNIKAAFERDKLILIESGTSIGWARLREAFLSADEADVPGAPVIHSIIRHLMLWQKLGVAQKPTADLAITWLKTLPSEKVLTSDEIRRVRVLLPRYPERIWNECQHWIDLDGRWTPSVNLKYARTMKSLVSYTHLFPEVKHKTADLHDLTEEFCRQPPFCNIPRLSDHIDERFKEPLGQLPAVEYKSWLKTLGEGLSRIITSNEGQTTQIRQLGNRLQNIVWQITDVLETVPYLEGNPVGTTRTVSALWKETTLYITRQSPAKIAKVVPEELGKPFTDDDIKQAILLCYDRSPDFITAYLEENFILVPLEEVKKTETEPPLGKPNVVLPGEESGKAGEVALPSDGEQSYTEPRTPPDDKTGNNGELDGVSKVEENPEEREQEPDTKIPKPHKLPKPVLIELFALKQGFSKDGSDRFSHPDGRWLARTDESIFHWAQHSPSGDVLQYYWLKDHCLEKEPLQIDAAVWGLCEKYPELYSVVLVSPQEEPIDISGRNLINMREEGKLELLLAAYRLVYKDER